MLIASWRSPYGETGILEFFLRVAATDDVDHDIMLHSLRLIGNACADTGKLSVPIKSYDRLLMKK
jgi:hypothetical protein